jgi:hypothetical protein
MIKRYYIIYTFLSIFFSSYANEDANFNLQSVFADRDLNKSQVPPRGTKNKISIPKEEIPGKEGTEFTESKYKNLISEDKVKHKYNKEELSKHTEEINTKTLKSKIDKNKKQISSEKYNESQATSKFPPDEGSWLLK